MCASASKMTRPSPTLLMSKSIAAGVVRWGNLVRLHPHLDRRSGGVVTRDFRVRLWARAVGEFRSPNLLVLFLKEKSVNKPQINSLSSAQDYGWGGGGCHTLGR